MASEETPGEEWSPEEEEMFARMIERIDFIQSKLVEERNRLQGMLDAALEIQAAVLANEIEQHLERRSEHD